MGKTTAVLIVALAAAGGAYVFRPQLEPLALQYLPSSITHAIGLQASANHAQAPGEAREGGQGGRRRGGGGGISPVTAAEAVLADMPVILSAPGTVEAIQTVAVKPRVDGQIVEVGFKEGDLVTAGAMLFRLDDRLVRAQIRQAEAAIARDQASLRDAESIFDRKQSLLEKKYASEATTETARQQVEVLKASIEAGRALLEAQRTQLDYLTIRAPITGRTGSVTGKLGSFVRSADSAVLVTINQTKPIAVSFALPQSNLDAMKAALLRKTLAKVTVPLTKRIEVDGTLIFVDNQVDKTTGAVTAKVQVENGDEMLWPGLAVGVDLTVEVRPGLVAVPASSVLPAQQGLIVWVIGKDDRVSIQTVTLDRTIGQTSYLTAGLKPGERVVTDGQLRLTPGGQVSIRDLRNDGGAATGSGSGKGGNAKGKGGEAGGGKGAKQGETKVDSPPEPKVNGRS